MHVNNVAPLPCAAENKKKIQEMQLSVFMFTNIKLKRRIHHCMTVTVAACQSYLFVYKMKMSLSSKCFVFVAGDIKECEAA